MEAAVRLEDFILLSFLGRCEAAKSIRQGKTAAGRGWASIFKIILNIPRGIPHLRHDGSLFRV